MSRGTLPPSLIFAGPDGVGKRMAALALAQLMNCLSLDQTGGEDACGTCASCKRIARGVHADVLLVEPGETGTSKSIRFARRSTVPPIVPSKAVVGS